MSLSIGTLVGYLQLDDSNFNRKADAADKKMSALQLELAALGRLHPKIQVDVDVQTAYLNDLKAHLADLKRQAAEGVDVRVETVATLMRLDEVRGRIREIKALAVAPVPLEIDTAGAEAKLSILGARIEWLKARLNSLGDVKGPSLLMTALLGLSPMLIPLGGAATAAFGAFAGGALTAAAGVGVLHMALKNLAPAAQAYEAYQQSLTKANTSYGSAMSKATSSHSISLGNALTAAQVRSANSSYAKARASASASLAQARANAQTTLDQSAYGSLSPQGRSFVQFDLTKLKPAGTHLQQTAQNAALPGIQQGLTEMLHLAPVANAAIAKIGGSVGDMAAKAGKALNDPFWRRWITWLGNAASKDLPILGSAAGHAFEGIARALKKLAPDSHAMLEWIDHLAKKFDHWTTTDGFTKFLDTIRKDAKVVGDFFKTAGPVIGDFAKGLASTGVAELSAFGAVFSVIGMLPPAVIQDLGKWLPIIVLAVKGLGIANSVATGIKAMGVAMGILDAEMDANPIGLVVLAIAALAAGLIYAYKHSETFRKIVDGAFHGVAEAAKWMWNDVLKPYFKFMTDAWLTVASVIVHGASFAFGWIPGLGPKLKSAVAKFDQFRDDVNNALNGIHPKDVQVNVTGVLKGPTAKTLFGPNGYIADSKHGSTASLQSLLSGTPGATPPSDPTLGGLVPSKPHQAPQHTVGAPVQRGVTFGDVYVEAHDYADFTRQLHRRSRAHALGGVG